MEELTEKEIAQLEVFQLVLQALFRREIERKPIDQPISGFAFHHASLEARDLLRKAGIDVI